MNNGQTKKTRAEKREEKSHSKRKMKVSGRGTKKIAQIIAEKSQKK